MKTKILALLRQQKDYVSGQEICDYLGVSRTAVWKVINRLKEEGYEIEAVQNKGYRLISAADILSASELESRIATNWAGRQVHYLTETTSTNKDAKKLAEEGAPHGTLVVADMQTAGRGRRGRTWQSPAGTNVYFTIVLKPELSPNSASMLTLVMAYAVAQAIEEVCHIETGIKWPNDIVINKKKVCGILTEMSAEMDYIHHVVIGVGINVGIECFDEDFRDKATSLFLETHNKVSRGELIQNIMEQFEAAYDKFLRAKDLTPLMEQYNALLVNKDKQVKVLEPQGEYIGCAKGINAKGELLVEKEDGTITEVYAGEVSVRGIYGYV